jgi:hypothetical protein
MNRTFLALGLVFLCGSFASAQQPAKIQPGQGTGEQPVLTPETVTPDMWYYSQEMRRHDDPRQAVRRKAEFVAQQRTLRIESMKWFGMSNSRPLASTTPFMDEYSPSWIGNSSHPYQWVGVGSRSAAIYYTPTVIVR